jgi:hypothetical protein
MVYLLSGLLIIHGVVCLLGTFFPFYPPVFLFYSFFPGYFAIKLVIVLLVGALQVAYGGYLAVKKQRWRIRWYWLAIPVILLVSLLLVYPTLEGFWTRVPW